MQGKTFNKKEATEFESNNRVLGEKNPPKPLYWLSIVFTGIGSIPLQW